MVAIASRISPAQSGEINFTVSFPVKWTCLDKYYIISLIHEIINIYLYYILQL